MGFIIGYDQMLLVKNPTHRKVVSPVKKIKGESRRISRDCVISPFSKVTKSAPTRAVVALQSRARRVRYVRGTRARPRVAGTIRIAT